MNGSPKLFDFIVWLFSSFLVERILARFQNHSINNTVEYRSHVPLTMKNNLAWWERRIHPLELFYRYPSKTSLSAPPAGYFIPSYPDASFILAERYSPTRSSCSPPSVGASWVRRPSLPSLLSGCRGPRRTRTGEDHGHTNWNSKTRVLKSEFKKLQCPFYWLVMF